MKHHTLIGIGGLVALVIVVAGIAILFNHSAQAPGSSASTSASTSTNKGSSMQLQKTDETVGTGAEAVAGKSVTVNYTGTLTNGTKFDSTAKDGGTPFTFSLGAGQVIQ